MSGEAALRFPSFTAGVPCRRAFSVVELLIVVLCMALLMTSLTWLFCSGSKTALEGRVKAELSLEAQSILRQIHGDLKCSTVVIDYSAGLEPIQNTFDRLLGNEGERGYRFLRFPQHGPTEAAIEPAGSETACRIPVEVVYEMTKEGPLHFRLTRREGNGTPALLSGRVNFLRIRENPLAPGSLTWLVTLQLVQAIRPQANPQSWQDLEAGGVTSDVEERLRQIQQGFQIVEYFDVVGPEFFSVYVKSNVPPNWQILVKKP